MTTLALFWCAATALLIALTAVAGARSAHKRLDRLQAEPKPDAEPDAEYEPEPSDPYRSPAPEEPLPAGVKRYCADCKWQRDGKSSEGNVMVCIAQPVNGKLPDCGTPTTNLNHDCEHYRNRQ